MPTESDADTPTASSETAASDADPAGSQTSRQQGVVLATILNVRDAPDLNSNILATVDGGQVLSVLESSADGVWLRICCPAGETAGQWISAEFLELSDTVVAGPDAATSSAAVDVAAAAAAPEGEHVAAVNADLVNVRAGPGTAYAVVGQTATGEAFAVVGRNDDGQWWQICCPADESQPGWISRALLELTQGQESALPLAEAPEPPPAAGAPAAAPAAAANNQAALAARTGVRSTRRGRALERRAPSIR